MLRSSLRAHTRSHHERIEQALNLPSSVQSREDFACLLAGFYGFYLPHETRLRRHAAALDAYGIEFASRVKSTKLRNDLSCLGMNDHAIDALPVCVDLPDLRTPGHALGSSYVLEGSTLGGQVIVRALNDRAEFGVRSAMNFLCGYGPRTATMWRSFVNALDAAQLEPEDIAAVHEGAVQTFETLERWMSAAYRDRGFSPTKIPVGR